ncbi:MAG: hypothetical protein FJ090_00700 [Deltaproteobacteria bacterium]|nr:hypothetical protein [Deltaproteobacteria bacterium]
MFRAFGYSNDTVDTQNPGRLCRGRERWLDGLPDTQPGMVFRTITSGAVFSDDSARDARRGFRHSGVSAGALLAALFPGARVYAFANAGDPLALPRGMALEEDWTYLRHGGVQQRAAVRWIAPVEGAGVDDMMAGERDGVACPRADGFVVIEGEPTPELADALYHLCGFAHPDGQPAELYAATALPEVLEHARAVVLLHLDKHGPGLAICTTEPLEADGTLRGVAEAAGAFPVPFAIPPMLARWDRALYEMRLDWDVETQGEFPVPPADDAGGRWSARSRRIGQVREDEVPEGGEE